MLDRKPFHQSFPETGKEPIIFRVHILGLSWFVMVCHGLIMYIDRLDWISLLNVSIRLDWIRLDSKDRKIAR